MVSADASRPAASSSHSCDCQIGPTVGIRGGPPFACPRRLKLSTTEDTEDTEDTNLMLVTKTSRTASLSAAMKVHTALGAGLLESTYSACLLLSTCARRSAFRAPSTVFPSFTKAVQVEARISHRFSGRKLRHRRNQSSGKTATRFMWRNSCRISSSVARPVGLLINFNVPHLRQGIRRVVNGYRSDNERRIYPPCPPCPPWWRLQW